jgi:hypothetical protein
MEDMRTAAKPFDPLAEVALPAPGIESVQRWRLTEAC